MPTKTEWAEWEWNVLRELDENDQAVRDAAASFFGEHSPTPDNDLNRLIRIETASGSDDAVETLMEIADDNPDWRFVIDTQHHKRLMEFRWPGNMWRS